jgi:lipoyl(octanoyl) transferase
MNEATLSVAWLGRMNYERAYRLQNAMVAARQLDEIGDILLLMEHPHVYTLGRGANEGFLVAPPPSVPVYRVSRGGQVTYHGPGQLIAYPIIALEGPGRDIHLYLRKLESAVIKTLALYGIEAGQREKLTGVWVGRHKIASIGVGIRRWVTLHGLALNINCDLRFFDWIVPCGIEGCQMTSMAREGQSGIDVPAVAESLAGCLSTELGYHSIEQIGPAEIWRVRRRAELYGYEADRG